MTEKSSPQGMDLQWTAKRKGRDRHRLSAQLAPSPDLKKCSDQGLLCDAVGEQQNPSLLRPVHTKSIKSSPEGARGGPRPGLRTWQHDGKVEEKVVLKDTVTRM